MTTKRMTSREVRTAFHKAWAQRCREVPAYRTDKPAMRQAFACFVDDLHRDDRISDRVANCVTLNEN
jgi:hypothetical protein